METASDTLKPTRLGNNMAWSLGLAGANYLFPLVVFMHVSRVLGVSGIGVVGFVDSVTTYFILFSMMGITSLGVRTMARAEAEGSRQEMSSAFWSLLSLQALFTCAVLLVMGVCIFAVPELRAVRHLMGIGVCKVIFNVFLVEWAFMGLERFRYIALRTLAIKTLYVVAVFLLVRRADDILTYYLLTMLVVLATAIVNMGRVQSELPLCEARIDMRRYLRAFFSLGVFELVATTLMPFCMMFLGFCSGDAETGCFSTASKVIALVAGLFWAYGQVMSARDSRLVKEGKSIDLNRHLRMGLWVAGGAGLAIGIMVFGFAPRIIWILSGHGFEGAVLPLRIMAAALPILALSKVLTMQVMVPSGYDRQVSRNSIAAFVVCAVLCAILTPRFAAAGAAIAYLSAEAVVCLLNAFTPGSTSQS